MMANLSTNVITSSRQWLLLVWFLSCFIVSEVPAQSVEKGFGGVWNIMTDNDRRIYLSGYLKAWEDSQKVLLVAKDYVSAEPKRAELVLDELIGLSLQPKDLDSEVRRLNVYYSQPENLSDSLSKAVSARKGR